jgi:hypothetical protein
MSMPILFRSYFLMKLYEVIFLRTGGKTDDDSDTMFLVRADDFRSALDEACLNGCPEMIPYVVHEIGQDLTGHPEDAPRILRGPYIAHAYNHGWKSWHRKIKGSDFSDEWEEK